MNPTGAEGNGGAATFSPRRAASSAAPSFGDGDALVRTRDSGAVERVGSDSGVYVSFEGVPSAGETGEPVPGGGASRDASAGAALFLSFLFFSAASVAAILARSASISAAFEGDGDAGGGAAEEVAVAAERART